MRCRAVVGRAWRRSSRDPRIADADCRWTQINLERCELVSVDMTQ
jgi:hypothetical protein